MGGLVRRNKVKDCFEMELRKMICTMKMCRDALGYSIITRGYGGSFDESSR